MDIQTLYDQTRAALDELLERAVRPFYTPELLVVGCSSSEALGGHIGHDSSPEAGAAIARAALDSAKAHNCALAAQCCEHLNRALVMEQSTLDRLRLTQVTVRPVPTAGGSTGAAAYDRFAHPAMAMSIQADAAIDVGDTLVGMHIRPVAVPLRMENAKVGQAHVVMAYSRYPLIGGARAQYPEAIR